MHSSFPVSERVAGIALFLLALCLFVSYDAFAKHMLHSHSAAAMNLSRYIAICAMALLMLAARPALWRQMAEAWREAHRRLLLIRSLMLAVVATSYMTALVSMPLAEATAIYFSAPLIMVVLSPWLLKEKVGAVQWIAVISGFMGMLLIVRPGSALPAQGVALMVLAAVCYAFFQMLTRKLSGQIAPQVLFAYMAIACLIVTSLPGMLQSAPLELHLPWIEWVLLLAGGIVSGSAQLLLLAAFRRVPASTLAPLNYIQLILALLISTFWFHRPPDALAFIGMGCITCAGVFLAWPRRLPVLNASA